MTWASRRAHGAIMGCFAVSILFVVVLAMPVTSGSASQTNHSHSNHASAVQPPMPSPGIALARNYGNIPLRFEANRGQTDPRVRFLTRHPHSTLFLAPLESVLAADNAGKVSALRMSLVGGDPNANASGIDPLPGTSNYFLGNDPNKWHTSIPNYARVKFSGVYPGIDLLYYGNNRRLEYDFVVAPHANPSRIGIKLFGAKKLRISPNGDLVATTRAGAVRLQRPLIYQKMGAERREIPGRYVLASANEVRFQVSPYDSSRQLIIDPVLQYATFLGGTASDAAIAVAADSQGNAYVTGLTTSPDFPTTASVLQPALHGAQNAFVSKITPDGTGFLYSTYLGGLSGIGDAGHAIAVDSQGNAYVAGFTKSPDFPVVPQNSAFQRVLKSNAGNAFVTKLDPTGTSLVYSTYLGGSGLVLGDFASGIAVDSNSAAYVTGTTSSSDFPVLNAIIKNKPGASPTAFVTKFSVDGTAVAYSTFLGGTGLLGDVGNGIVVDANGNAFVAGGTTSSDFPVTAGAFQTAFSGNGFDAFLTEINAAGSQFAYSTLLGGPAGTVGTQALDVALDLNGVAYVTGFTDDTSYPVTGGVFGPLAKGSGGHAIVAKINPAGAGAADLVYSTFLGGTNNNLAPSEEGRGIAVDSGGNATITGRAQSIDFPTTPGAVQTSLKSPAGNAFVSRVNPTASALLYSTLLGGTENTNGDFGSGVSLDGHGNEYISGVTFSPDFPVTPGSLQTLFKDAAGKSSGFVAKFSAGSVVTALPASVSFPDQLINQRSGNRIVTFTNNSAAPLNISSVAIIGPSMSEFPFSSQCGATLASGKSCNVAIGFLPTVLGPANATLAFTDNDPSSPQQVPLSGKGIVDFTITATSSVSVKAGSSVNITVTMAPIDGSTQTIDITCGGNPPKSTCTVLPGSVTLDGTNNQTSTVTVSTTNTGNLGVPDVPLPGNFSRRMPLLFFVTMLVLLFGHLSARRRAIRIAFGAAALACITLAGCGGHSNIAGTPRGPSTLVITGTATTGGQTHMTTVSLTVD